MIPAKQLLREVVSALRNVIAAAIAEPYPKTQAYMAALILEFIARQVEERADIAHSRHAAISALFRQLAPLLGDRSLSDGEANEAHLSEIIEKIYKDREALGEENFIAANRLIRATLRELLDQELKVAGPSDG